MPYFDKDGTEVEGLLTPAEVDAKIDTANADVIKQYEEEQGKTATKIAELTKAVDDAKAGVNKGVESGDKDVNMASLRKKLEETETALKGATTVNEERWKGVRDEKVGLAVQAIAGEDAELGKKIKHHFDTTLSAMPADTAEQVKARRVQHSPLSARGAGPPECKA